MTWNVNSKENWKHVLIPFAMLLYKIQTEKVKY